MSLIYLAEFDKPFLDMLSAYADAGPLELFSNPKIYLHAPNKPAPDVYTEGAQFTAAIRDVGFAYHPKLETTQLVIFLEVEEAPEDHVIYASIVNDAYRSKSSRRYSRSLVTAILEQRLKPTIKVYGVDTASEMGKIIVETFSVIDWDSLV
jgi:hypothetical protein